MSSDRLIRFWEYPSLFSQPGLFFPADAWRTAGGLDEHLHYAMDYALLCRMLRETAVVNVSPVGAQYRIHEHSKTATQAAPMLLETLAISRLHWSKIAPIDRGSRRRLVQHVVRQFGTEMLSRRLASAARVLTTSVRLDALLTLECVGRQLISGIRRRATQRTPEENSCASSR